MGGHPASCRTVGARLRAHLMLPKKPCFTALLESYGFFTKSLPEYSKMFFKYFFAKIIAFCRLICYNAFDFPLWKILCPERSQRRKRNGKNH